MNPRLITFLKLLKVNAELIIAGVYALGVVAVACILAWRESVAFSLSQTGMRGYNLAVDSVDMNVFMTELAKLAPAYLPDSVEQIKIGTAVTLGVVVCLLLIIVFIARLPKLNKRYPRVVQVVFIIYPFFELLTILAEWYTFVYFGGLSIFAYQSVPAQPIMAVQLTGVVLALRHVVLGSIILVRYSKVHVIVGAIVDLLFVVAAIIFTRQLTAISPFVSFLLWVPIVNQIPHLTILVGSTVENQIPLIPAGQAWTLGIKRANIVWFAIAAIFAIIPAALPFTSSLYFACPASVVSSSTSCAVMTQPLFAPCDCLSLQITQVDLCGDTSAIADANLLKIVNSAPTVMNLWITDFSGDRACPSFNGFQAISSMPYLETLRVRAMVPNSGLSNIASFPVGAVMMSSLVVVQLNGLKLGTVPLKLSPSIQLLDMRNNSLSSTATIPSSPSTILLSGNPVCTSAPLTRNVKC